VWKICNGKIEIVCFVIKAGRNLTIDSNLLTLSVPDEDHSNLLTLNVPDEDYSNLSTLNVPDEDYSNLFALSVPDEDYSRNAS
jgi:hypothetical protein